MTDSRARRLRALADLIRADALASQEEVTARLKALGHQVTQATVSRDLDRMGVVRVRRHGRLVYALSEESDLTPADPVGAVVLALGLVRTMEASGNLVVLKTGPANAHPVAFAFDNASFPEIIGTIAGDDTAALIAREPHTGHDLIRMIEQLQKETP